MGVALWLSSAAIAFALARIVPPGRPARFLTELLTSLVAALILGSATTAADFGGWNEMEWRAAVFVFCGTAAAIAMTRITRLARRAA